MESKVAGDVAWLLESLDDIMLNFQMNKPNILALDYQNERIARLKQKENVENDDFIKIVQKDIIVYGKYGGNYVWGEQQQDEVSSTMNKLSANIQKQMGDNAERDRSRRETSFEQYCEGEDNCNDCN